MTYETTESLYPNKIDPWIFFQDVNNDKESTYNEFLNLTKSEKYSDAQKLMHDNNVDIFDAELLMCIQNRIRSLQNIIKIKEKPSHHRFDISPTGYREVPIYVNGELVEFTFEKIDPSLMPDKMIWVNSYENGGPLLTESLQAIVIDGKNDALGYTNN